MPDPSTEYKQYILANLPSDITVDPVTGFFRHNGHAFPTYLQCKWYKDYINKFRERFNPSNYGMDWFNPDISYTGTPSSVTGLVNQRDGGLPLQYIGNGPLTLTESLGTTYVTTPETNLQQRLVQNIFATPLNGPANAPFTLAMAFSLSPSAAAATTLWSTASIATESFSRINLSVSNGLLRIFSVDPANTATGVPLQAAIQPGAERQTVLIVAKANGTLSCWFNGVFVEDNLVWQRPAFTDLDQFTFGALSQGASNAQTTIGSYSFLAFKPAEITEQQAFSFSEYLYKEFN